MGDTFDEEESRLHDMQSKNGYKTQSVLYENSTGIIIDLW